MLAQSASPPRAGKAREDTCLGRRLVVSSLLLAGLAFIPLVPRVDPLAGGGTTVRGAIEMAMLAGSLLLAAGSAPLARVARDAAASPAALAALAFAGWCGVTMLWSPNAILTFGKSLELVIITCIAQFVLGSPGGRARLEDRLALALAGTLLVLFLFNVAIYGNPFPFLEGDEPSLGPGGAGGAGHRARLHIAYAHPLIAGDMIALTAITLAASSARPALKATGLATALLLIALTDSRTAMAATPTALLALWIAGNAHRYPRAIGIAAAAAGLVASGLGLLIVNGFLFENIRPGEELLTLNGRVELWQHVWPIFAENWATGIGFYGSRYVLLSKWSWAGHTHHSLVEVALGTGVLGLALFLALLGMAARAIVRTRDRLLVGVCAYVLIIGNIDPILIDTSLPTFVFFVALFRASAIRPPGGGPGGSWPASWRAQP